MIRNFISKLCSPQLSLLLLTIFCYKNMVTNIIVFHIFAFVEKFQISPLKKKKKKLFPINIIICTKKMLLEYY